MKYKKSGRVMTLLLSAVLTLCLLPLPVRAAGAETGVQLGDYIRLGSYDGEPILWRCVSVDENGPLMLSDKVLCDSMPYDAQTSKNSTSGSHRRSGYRSKYGSNHWRDSDMRSWLNSDAKAGQVKWLCGNPPKDGYIMGGGAYDGKAGFLNGFTRDEAAAIKTVTQRSIVSHPEYTAGYIDASGADLPYNTDIDSVADGYEGAHYENITDKVFLLDVKQLCTVYENLGSYYIAQNRNGVNWSYWLRTPVTDCNHDMRYVSPQGSIGRDAPCKGYYGVRPAFYLDAAYYAVTSGSGTETDPYVGTAPNKPADSTPLSPAERDTGDGNWDVDTETYLQVEMSDYYTKDPEYANATIPVYVIQKPRSDTENMVILFCAEGYTKSQQADFIQDVQKLWQATLNTEPYRSMADRFNVYALCTASKEGFGGNTFFRANTDGISTNFGNWRNHIFERIIGTSFLEKIHDAHIPNTTKPQDEDYSQYNYVYEHINQFVVLANSGEYFGGSHDDIKSGIHYILAAAKNSYSKFILRHELGHGLFHLGDEYATSAEMKDGDILKVSIDVENTGKRAGSEVVQLYVSDKDSTVPRAVKELKGFAKVFLNPGEKKTVTMELCARDFAYYETKIHDWYTPSGTYEIQIGHASDEIREAAELTFTTDVLLPFTVDMTTTMGELMNHPKTAGKMMEYLEGISQGEEPKKEDGEVQLVTPEIIAQMPLKSFLSVIPGEAIEQMIVELNALCQ